MWYSIMKVHKPLFLRLKIFLMKVKILIILRVILNLWSQIFVHLKPINQNILKYNKIKKTHSITILFVLNFIKINSMKEKKRDYLKYWRTLMIISMKFWKKNNNITKSVRNHREVPTCHNLMLNLLGAVDHKYLGSIMLIIIMQMTKVECKI